MSKKKTYAENHSADSKAIGFDFQYFYFLYRLIKLDLNESIGLEVKDDVHITFNNKLTLIQLKHSVQTKSDGKPIPLTTRDTDLWKTLSNWSEIICDKNDGRSLVAEQENFVNDTTFLLVTNKSETSDNAFLNNLQKFQTGNIDFSQFVSEIETIKKATKKGSKLINYIDNFLSLDASVLSIFLTNIEFKLSVDNIIEDCKLAIKAKLVPENRIDEVFKNLDSQIREDNFFAIKSGEKFQIHFNDFYRKYRRHFDKGRSASLVIREYTDELPDKLEDQTFIKQILDINDIKHGDYEVIAEYTRFKLKMKNNIEIWLQEGELTLDEIKALERDAINKWKNEHRQSYRGNVDNNEINSKAQAVLDAVRNKGLEIANQKLDSEMSNGEFYCLSDEPKIGWRNDWEARYK